MSPTDFGNITIFKQFLSLLSISLWRRERVQLIVNGAGNIKTIILFPCHECHRVAIYFICVPP